MTIPKETEIVQLKRFIAETRALMDHLDDDIMRKLVRKKQAKETLDKLNDMLRETEERLTNEMRSVQTIDGNERQLCDSGREELPPQVSGVDEERSETE